MEEKELSIIFSVPSSMYTRLFLTLSNASIELYTKQMTCIKNSYKISNSKVSKQKKININSDDDDVEKNNENNEHNNNYDDDSDVNYDTEDDYDTSSIQIRTMQTECGFVMQSKKIISENVYKSIYKHIPSNLTLILSIKDRCSIEKIIDLNKYKIKKYKQIIREYIYCRQTGLRIAIERHFIEYNDPDIEQMNYDCFNRYKFDCLIHIEYENSDLKTFRDLVSKDEIIYNLFLIMTTNNLNNVSDELINIKNMTLTHNFGYLNLKKNENRNLNMDYYALKYDGIRKNFCIFGKYLYIDKQCFKFENHWFGQTIIGHCEIMKTNNKIIIIDIYLISENYRNVAIKNHISYTSVLQNYHHFYNNGSSNTTIDNNNGPKTKDEYFHMKRLFNKIKFISPVEAIKIIQLFSNNIWKNEKELMKIVQLQKFFENIHTLTKYTKKHLNLNEYPIDGILSFNTNKIYKIKTDLTIDLLLKFDEMFRFVYKKMKTNNQQDLKKIIQFINIQKTLNWLKFDQKYPNLFNIFIKDFLYFSKNEQFIKHFPLWEIIIDLHKFTNELYLSKDKTFFIILVEFNIDYKNKKLLFKCFRNDKCSANSVKVFKNISRQYFQ